MMEVFDWIVLGIFLFICVVYLTKFIKGCFVCPKERESIIVERLGQYNTTLGAGINCIIPILDRMKVVKVKYLISENDVVHLRERSSHIITTQNEVMDFPMQPVITRDNAKIFLDAVLQYRIVNPKQMVYSVTNLPNVLSKMLQAQLRDVAGALDVDRIIEDTAILDRVAGELDMIARNWGVKIEMVKIQKVQADELSEVLAQKKNADFKNREVIINAKASKQTKIITAEGQRDQKIREAEGEAQRIVASARGQAEAVMNEAESEARSIKEIARSLEGSGDDPTMYLLALKYIDALKAICASPNTKVIFVPQETIMLQTAQLLGLNTVIPARA